jgi:hypothetical protein
MSTDNPYVSPGNEVPVPRVVAPPISASTQPSGFMAIMVIMLILGILGTLASLMGIVGLIAAPTIQAMAERPQPGQPQAMHELNVQMQREIREATDRWRPFSFVIVAVHLLVAGAILAGAILCLRRNPTGLPLLQYGSGSAICYELINLMVQAVVQMETMPITARFTKRMMEVAPGNANGAKMGEVMGTMMNVIMWVVILFMVAWAVAKIVADVIAIRYTLREDVQRYIGAPPSQV